ncbi:uncharacterized protein LOC126895093 [Daktulosphaira vitifoliae]|uniref:uncharacterized protein LOC126895093 n=1 Tax=Daktulosphaira vitifoliae TaxID=58002 RepID=UPI0021A98FD4|nr:uncharacterized protein LOC126895093 [Daktulosphaira vitifoliae]
MTYLDLVMVKRLLFLFAKDSYDSADTSSQELRYLAQGVKLWLQKINWDDVLPIPLQQDWSKMRVELEQINNIKINRLVLGIEKIKKLELHAFADASMQAYGTCIYTRATDIYGKVVINLLCAKSRVAPLKVVSLPRLELLAALLAARLMSKYASKLQLPINEYFYWTDSTLVLNWLLSPSSRWKTFVGNRVSEIQELTSVSQWRHVASSDNPADIVSRGCFPSQMKGLDLWWNGPSWLKGEHTQWPSNFQELTYKSEYLSEEKSNFLSSDTNIYGPVEATEIENALKRLVKVAQQEEFFTELCDLKNSKLVSSKNKLFRLKPFLDNDGIIRVSGRLKHAVSLSFFQKHPIVLPADSAFTKLLFLDEHEKSLHAGPQAMLANIRLRYWPINGRNIARNISRKCVKCFKYKPVVFEPIMGDLPKDRVEPARAFVKCGVDFAGPVFVRSSLRRNAPKTKAYISIWVCLVTKAIHIELVGDLTAESFLNALRRFCDRRGYCTDVYSDNGKNFVAVNRQLREVHELLAKPEVKNESSNKGIQWHFIPARSPHFGGLWEASVKSVKAHLLKSIGNALFNYEELYTILVRVEAILNSRPLTPFSTDPSDLSVLTPGHFLIGDSLSAFPERDVTNIMENRLTRWRRVVQITQKIWIRWKNEYLNQLQERKKWSQSNGPGLKKNTVVLMRDENLPPLKWSIGIIMEVHSGSDGVVRVATIRTATGVYKRAVRQLCPLPFEGNCTASSNN